MFGSFLGAKAGDAPPEDPSLPSQHQKEREEIEQLRSKLSSVQSDVVDEIERLFEDRFDRGEIMSMPSTERLVEIQDGWEQRRIYENGRFDAWLRESEPGAELPPHEHPDHDRFIVLVEGKMTVTLNPGEEDEEHTVLDTEEEGGKRVLHLPPGKEVCAESIDDCVTVQVFHPPVAQEEVQKQ
jgi:hypothetical protein